MTFDKRQGIVVGLIAYASVAAFYSTMASMLAGLYLLRKRPGLLRRLIPLPS